MEPEHASGVKKPQIPREGSRQVRHDDHIILGRPPDRGVTIEKHILLIGQIIEPPDAGRLNTASLSHLPEPRWLLTRRLEADVVPLEIRAEIRIGRIAAEDSQLHFQRQLRRQRRRQVEVQPAVNIEMRKQPLAFYGIAVHIDALG